MEKSIESTEDHVGTHFCWTYKMAGLHFQGESTVVEHVANRKIVTQTKGGIQSTWTFIFEQKNGETKQSFKIDYTVPVPVLGTSGRIFR